MRELVRKLRRGISTPHLAVRQVNRMFYRWCDPTEAPVDVFGEDWDTLLILDACRYDVFAERHDLPGRLEKRVVASSSTLEFLEAYVDGADLRDTVYVTANPQLRRHLDEYDVTFHDVIDVWEGGTWDDSLSTVHPRTVAEAALETHARYPNKRLVVHFIQPHHPYIGPTGRSELPLDSIGHFWGRVHSGELEVDDRVLRRAYEENLDAVLEHVDRLLGTLAGRTVVTADHGEMLGERCGLLPVREYGHPPGFRAPSLVTVPWLVFERGPRREITSGDPRTAGEASAAGEVEERLRALGYT